MISSHILFQQNLNESCTSEIHHCFNEDSLADRFFVCYVSFVFDQINLTLERSIRLPALGRDRTVEAHARV